MEDDEPIVRQVPPTQRLSEERVRDEAEQLPAANDDYVANGEKQPSREERSDSETDGEGADD